ncbi:CotY/CotZ family spore coat protein [Viridibacillus sp. NPDC093762]|uniref:CotY/CotZ family spore coat protein n=1 Tax=Viridibacillus sp. NPDC093762 TaxID=3390720 RepID=UPI003D0930CF
MGCGRNDDAVGHKVSKGCVCDVVRAIKDIQDQNDNDDCDTCPTNCFLEPLGGLVSPARTHANTRVFMLLNKDGTPFKAFFRTRASGDHHCFSVFFRVEDIFDRCCATLRVLIPLKHGDCVADLLTDCGTDVDLSTICKVVDWEASTSCVTVDLNCFCAVQCIKDVFLEGVCD